MKFYTHHDHAWGLTYIRPCRRKHNRGQEIEGFLPALFALFILGCGIITYVLVMVGIFMRLPEPSVEFPCTYTTSKGFSTAEFAATCKRTSAGT